MAHEKTEQFLNESSIARRVRAPARVVLRRFTSTGRELDAGLNGGSIEVECEPACDLVVGGRIVARGKLVEENGRQMFCATEVIG